MGRNPIDAETLKAEIERLPDLGLNELRTRWKKLYGRRAPKFFRRKLLVRAVAYQMQVEAYGGLSTATKRRLREIAAAVRAGNEEAVIPGPRIKLGTRLYRSWQGKTHCVLVLPDGFEWQGSRFGSLSAVAKAITGTNWNGFTFFGIKRRPSKNKNAAGPRRKDAAAPAQPRGQRKGSRTRPVGEDAGA
jgi:DUF2924 family protein